MDHVPRLVVDGYLAPCLAHFCDLFSASHRSRSIRAQSLAALTKLLTSLSSFLRRAFPGGGAGEDGADAAGAGPGPSSARQAALQAAAAAAGPLGADRTRWPARSGAELMAGLEGMFRAAAAATRAGRGKKGSKLGATDGVDKNRGKKGRGSVSTSEAFMSTADAAAATNAGKSIAAAAAALAAVAAPSSAAAAAGMDLAAPSGAAAAAGGVLGAGTTMAAALVAASDARASALRLVSLLMDCWLECTPGQLATAPEAEQAAAVLMVLSATNTLMDKLLLPPAAASGGSAEAQLRLQLLQHLHDLVAKRVTGCFPTTSPPVKPAAMVADTLVRINLQTAELLCRFLPLLAHQPPQQQHGADAMASGPLQWVPSLVGFYVSVLEDGVLLPATAGTLSEAPAAATAGLSGGASEAVLASVAAAVQNLDAASAQRLMGAVASFASRQTARSTARVASTRMQHGLLRAALAGA